MPTETLADYNCTESELYTIANTEYDSLSDHLVDFEGFSPRYTAVYLAGLRGNRSAAMLLPDDSQRSENHEILFTEVVADGKTCTDNFQTLKAYIKRAYPANFKIMYGSAGIDHYEKAVHGSWVDLQALNLAANSFISGHTAALELGLNMPATFITTYSDGSDAFDLKYADFLSAKSTTDGKNAKIAANNLIYADLQGVNNDGQKVYMHNDGLRKLFVFDTVKDLVSPPGSASYKVTVKRAGLLTVVVGIPVTIQSRTAPAITVNTNAEGVALFPHLDPDNYTVTIESATLPLVPQVFKKDVDTGVDAHSEVFMVAV